MTDENPATPSAENEPESITPEIVDENDVGMIETGDDEPPVDDPADDENPSDPNLPDPNLPDLNLIDEAAAFIRTTIAAMIENAALKIGDYLLARFFDGDIELAISRNRYKNVSFSHLCRRPDIRGRWGLWCGWRFRSTSLSTGVLIRLCCLSATSAT